MPVLCWPPLLHVPMLVVCEHVCHVFCMRVHFSSLKYVFMYDLISLLLLVVVLSLNYFLTLTFITKPNIEP